MTGNKPTETDQDISADHPESRRVKEQITNHWDIDMMTREQLDQLATESRSKHRQHSVRKVAIVVAAVAAGAALMLLGYWLLS